MSVDRSRLKARTLDRQRARHVGADRKLILLSYAQVGGESVLATIKEGWSPTQKADAETSVVTVQIADQSLITATMMKQIDRFRILDKVYRVERGGIIPPLSEPKIWIINGEEIRV